MNSRITLRKLLGAACADPARVKRAYATFHELTFFNQILALLQCERRRVEPARLATEDEWSDEGVFVRSGESAFSLCQPTHVADGVRAICNGLRFTSGWFLETQTTSMSSVRATVPDPWSIDVALRRSGVVRLEFRPLTTDEVAYSFKRFVAVSPNTEFLEKALLHEFAHVWLGHSDEALRRHRNEIGLESEEIMAEAVALLVGSALGLPGASSNALPIRRALAADVLSEQDCLLVFESAAEIVAAGRCSPFPRPTAPHRRRPRPYF
jgi:hypothetical protein